MAGSPGEEYLASRGFRDTKVAREVDKFSLGYVADPMPGHEKFQGFLAIPYLRRSPEGDWSVASMRFRCIDPECSHKSNGHGKYMATPGVGNAMFNTLAAVQNDLWLAVCEGEIDAVTATAHGIPAVAVSGVDTWEDHYKYLLQGFERVFVLADSDDNGQGLKFAKKVVSDVPNALVVPAKEGHDVNSEINEFGKEGLLERMKV